LLPPLLDPPPEPPVEPPPVEPPPVEPPPPPGMVGLGLPSPKLGCVVPPPPPPVPGCEPPEAGGVVLVPVDGLKTGAGPVVVPDWPTPCLAR